MVIAFTGYAQSGKDTAGAYFMSKGYTRVGFADKLKEMALSVLKMTSPLRYVHVCEVGWDRVKKEQRYRKFLQDFGSLMRQDDPDYWVNKVRLTIGILGDVVITDLRYPNEARSLRREYETIIIRVIRPGTGPTNAHSSENELDKIEPDFVVENDGSIEELHSKLESILGLVIGTKIHREISDSLQ